jgi:transposase-like protein
MLVIIGVTSEGHKELIGFQVGRHERAQSWHELLVDLKARSLTIVPELAVTDGALGFWKALDEILPGMQTFFESRPSHTRPPRDRIGDRAPQLATG